MLGFVQAAVQNQKIFCLQLENTQILTLDRLESENFAISGYQVSAN